MSLSKQGLQYPPEQSYRGGLIREKAPDVLGPAVIGDDHPTPGTVDPRTSTVESTCVHPQTPLSAPLPLNTSIHREHVLQPPAITTSLSGLRLQGAGLHSAGGHIPTPISMSSPFYSSGPLSGLTTMPSPMSSRPRSYNSRYNPQEWGPISAGSSPVVGIGIMHHSSSHGTEASPVPPPPYSPPRPNYQDLPIQSPHVGFAPVHHHAPASTPNQRGLANLPQEQRENTGFSNAFSHTPTNLVASVGESTSFGELSTPSVGYSQSTVTPNSAGRCAYQSLNSLGRRAETLSSMSLASSANTADLIPPASRRAASTGDIRHERATRLANADLLSRSSRWEPGMPLPPPPPGPPPVRTPAPSHSMRNTSRSNAVPGGMDRARSVSASSTIDPGSSTLPIDRRSNQLHSNTLNPLPGTLNIHQLEPSLHDTPNVTSTFSNENQIGDGPLLSSNLNSSKGIRERRIQSRGSKADNSPLNHGSKDENSDRAWPSDLVLGTGPKLVRRPTVTRSTPRSARSNASEDRDGTNPARSPLNNVVSSNSAFSTPMSQNPQHTGATDRVQTPPFSPGQKPLALKNENPNLPPKSLPTPPITQQESSSLPRLTSRSMDSDRPISHLLHIPFDSSEISTPLVPAKSLNSPSVSIPSKSKFIQRAESRYHDCLLKESSATNTSDALKAFCDFITFESNVRRQYYGPQWDNLSFDPTSIVDKLFSRPVNRFNGADPHNPNGQSQTISGRGALKRQLSLAESGVGNGYKPALSPIASMSMSNDEMSSRGRPPSRWWESQTGSDSGDNAHKISRSKREAKYMGLPREMREAMQLEHLTPTQSGHPQDYSSIETNPFRSYGPNEYPPEKAGWREQETVQPLGPSRSASTDRDAQKLDISRLITLPPPYPRHYPGVNNNHPDLAYYRSTVRSVSDLSELQTTKENYQQRIKNSREEYRQNTQKSLREFIAHINQGIEQGTVSYAEAADAEARRRAQEYEQDIKLLEDELNSYQNDVSIPMQNILEDRIKIVTDCIEELGGKLVDLAKNETPNQPQEEGDEQPELLEKLTQLKWLFEARENLFRQEYDLISERNEKYQAVVSLPYKQKKNAQKLRKTDEFFNDESQKRRFTFTSQTLKRFEKFMDVVEANVSRGVEIQLSAFWDIAPSISTILQNVPDDLRGFSVQIPNNEYDENPSYYRYPLQYLFSLVSHAEKSTYQFIESQINLLCLLHEIKVGLMNANCKFMEVERINSGETAERVKYEMHESSSEEEKVLTLDLKEKVNMVEGQWMEALGKQLGLVKRTVQQWLEAEGGWEEMVQMEQN
ncbi:hypothetical protein FQN57_002282 [Myotisia sp. PD_48]|nr:hypothetical protein FQN57_002282 [Myotisia sp. PD_48]